MWLNFTTVMLSLLVLVAASFTAPLGVHPEMYDKYSEAINEKDSTFKCLDGSKIIPLDQVNDNYPDCPDFSDEPGTGLKENSTFYCINKYGVPMEIPFWSVGDGICDCCDGSDEFFNKHANCTNICVEHENKRISAVKELSRLAAKYSKSHDTYQKKGKTMIESASTKISEIEKTIEKLRKKESDVWKNKALGVKVPRRKTRFNNLIDEVFVKLWELIFHVPRADLMCEESRRGMKSEAINTKIRAEESEKRKCQAIADWNNETDPAFAPLFAREFTLDDFTLTFMKEIKNGRESLGSFQNIGLVGQHHYRYGMRSQRTDLKIVCGSANRLIDVKLIGERIWEAVFASPIACAGIESFDKYSYEELSVLARGFGMNL